MSSGIPSGFAGARSLIAAAQTAIIAAINAVAALIYFRAADTGNSRALANLGIGAVWTGTGKNTNGYARVDLWITCVQIGSFTLDESDDGIAWTTTETWPTTAGLVNQYMPFPLSRRFWRIVYTQGAAAGNVAIAAVLDPNPISDSIPLFVTARTACLTGNTVQIARPLGARFYEPHLVRQAGPQAGDFIYYPSSATSDTEQARSQWDAAYTPQRRLRIPSQCRDLSAPTQITFTERGTADSYVWVDFYS